MDETDSKLFPRLSDDQIARLMTYGRECAFAPGETLFAEGSEQRTFFVILSGEVRVVRSAGAAQALTLALHRAGDFTGEISLIAGGRAIATGTAVGPVRALALEDGALDRALTEQEDIRRTVVPAMAARRPEADALVMQREKLAALGKLSAGLAHELNNPAAAASRAAAQLAELVLRQMAQAICFAGGCAGDAEVEIRALLGRGRDANAAVTLGAMERSDREDEVSEWLAQLGAPEPWRMASELVGSGIGRDDLDSLAAVVRPAARLDVVRWLAGTAAALSLVTQIEVSTTRISELVGAVKTFTHRDGAAVEDVSIPAGLDATLTILHHRLGATKVRREYRPDLPTVVGRAGDLNQVWSNLIDNAIDATEGRGEIRVAAHAEGDGIVVEISDTGSGIAAHVIPHVFEPFFTTKGIGKGVGLGLDSVHRIVQEHHGEIEVSSKPGETVFRVRLPLRPPAEAAAD